MSNNFLYKYLSLFLVTFKDTVYIFYYEIHLKYCQGMDVNRKTTIYFNNGNKFAGKSMCSLSYPGAWETIFHILH
jgi:hypothetical protein